MARAGSAKAMCLLVLVFTALVVAAPQGARATSESRDHAVTLCAQAQAKFVQGDMDGAYADYQAADEIFKDIARKQPSDTRAIRDLAAISGRFGDLYTRTNRGNMAQEAYERSVEIATRLSNADPGNPGLLLDLAVISMKLGDLYVWLAKADQAEDAYRLSLATGKALAMAEGGLKTSLQNNCLVLYRLRSLFAKLGQIDKARFVDGQESEVRRDLNAAAPGNGQNLLFADFQRLAEQYTLVGQDLDAIDAYQETLEIGLALSQAEPENLEYLAALSGVFRSLGELHMRQGQFEAAFSAYQEVLGISTRLAEAAPENLENRRDMLVTHYKLGIVLEAAQQPEQALREFEAALHLARETAAKYGEEAQLEGDISEVRKKIEALSR